MFHKKSRYANLTSYKVKDRRGRTVQAAPVPPASGESLLGYHTRIQGQRLDHLAHQYLDDDTGFWRICEINNAMHPEMLSEKHDIAIPKKSM